MNTNIISLLQDLNMPQDVIDAAERQLEVLKNTELDEEQKNKALLPLVWKHTPESIEEMTHECFYCEECSCFHERWVGTGVVIEDGDLMVTTVECDRDGNWECVDSVEILSVEEYGKATAVDYEQIQQGWLNYYQGVKDTGKDELVVFYVHDTETQMWEVTFHDSFSGVEVISAQCVEPVKGSVCEGDEIPKEILEFCLAGQNHIVDISLGKDVYSLLSRISVRIEGNGIIEVNTKDMKEGGLSIKVRLFMPRGQEDMKQELIEKAIKSIGTQKIL